MLAAMMLLGAACQGGSGDGEVTGPVPTRTLIPPTLTPADTPAVLSPTPTDLPSPATLAAATLDAAGMAPPVIQRLLDRLTDNLVTEQRVERDDLRLLSVDRFVWPDEQWGCSGRSSATGAGAYGYRIAFSTTRRVYVYHTDETGKFFLCEDAHWLVHEGAPVLLDPIAQSMVDLMVQDAAQRLALPEDAFELVSMLTLVWPDSSVGCPKAGGDYQDQIAPGYRVVLRAGDERLLYHASSRHIVFCTPQEEILPGVLRQALP